MDIKNELKNKLKTRLAKIYNDFDNTIIKMKNEEKIRLNNLFIDRFEKILLNFALIKTFIGYFGKYGREKFFTKSVIDKIIEDSILSLAKRFAKWIKISINDKQIIEFLKYIEHFTNYHIISAIEADAEMLNKIKTFLERFVIISAIFVFVIFAGVFMLYFALEVILKNFKIYVRFNRNSIKKEVKICLV